MMNIQKMMKQAQQMKQKIQDKQAELEAIEVEGTAGGGMVKVLLSGKSKLLSLSIDDSLVVVDEKDMLEDLIVAAFNDAKTKVDDTYDSEMGKVAGGMNLPKGLPF